MSVGLGNVPNSSVPTPIYESKHFNYADMTNLPQAHLYPLRYACIGWKRAPRIPTSAGTLANTRCLSNCPQAWASSRRHLLKPFAAARLRSYGMAAKLPELPPVERLSPRVIRILGGNPGKYTLQGTNTYLVGTGATRLLIDTGEGHASWRTHLAAQLAAEQCTIGTVVLTHWHGDHIGGAPAVLELCPNATLHKFPGGPSGASSPEALAHASPLSGLSVAPLRDGETLQVTGATLRVVHAPGHTNDHVALVLADEDDALFSGDAVLGHGTAVFEDLATYVRSLGVMEAAVGPAGRIYPAHGQWIAAGRAKCREYIDHRQQREREICAVLAEGRPVTAMEIVQVVYREYPVELHAPAEGGVRLVLKKLAEEGRVSEKEGRWASKEAAAL